jgi:hypothetical protein
MTSSNEHVSAALAFRPTEGLYRIAEAAKVDPYVQRVVLLGIDGDPEAIDHPFRQWGRAIVTQVNDSRPDLGQDIRAIPRKKRERAAAEAFIISEVREYMKAEHGK